MTVSARTRVTLSLAVAPRRLLTLHAGGAVSLTLNSVEAL